MVSSMSIGVGFSAIEPISKLSNGERQRERLGSVVKLYPSPTQNLPSEAQILPNQSFDTRLSPFPLRLHLRKIRTASP